jgi:hypothetical protein
MKMTKKDLGLLLLAILLILNGVARLFRYGHPTLDVVIAVLNVAAGALILWGVTSSGA